MVGRERVAPLTRRRMQQKGRVETRPTFGRVMGIWLRRAGGRREEVGEHLAEFGGEDRLVEDAVDLEFVIRLADGGAEFGAENQNLAGVRQGADAFDQFDAVDVGHVVVGDDEIVGRRIGGDALQRFLAVADAFDEVTFATERDASDFAEFAHVVGVKDTQKFFRWAYFVGKHWVGTRA